MEINKRPREKFINNGASSLSDIELLAIIIKSGIKDKSVFDLSKEVLDRINNLNNLVDININTLNNIKGLGNVKKIELLASLELAKRIYLNHKRITKYLTSDDIYNDNKDLFYNKKQEYFYCVYLDNKNNIIDKKLLFIGTINRSIVHPREIFREAYLLSASKFICLHNHPSGDITPSNEDIYLTKNLIEISYIQGITFLDHLIISNNKYYSFYNESNLFNK
jgi:DNA repair protein RadC